MNEQQQHTNLAEDIESIRAKLLDKAGGTEPNYSVRVQIGDSDSETGALGDLMASHTVYTRTSY